MFSCITIREREHAYKFTRWCDPPGGKTPTSMITTLHTLSLASITHHTNSPRVRLRRLPRARPQLTRPPLLVRRCRPSAAPVRSPARPRSALPDHRQPSAARRASRRARSGCQSTRPPVLAARCPTIACHLPLGAPPTTSAAASHPGAAAQPPPPARHATGHERDAQRRC